MYIVLEGAMTYLSLKSTLAVTTALLGLSTTLNAIPESERTVPSPLKQAATEPKINLNTADVATLTLLVGVGLYKAKAIVDFRRQCGKFEKITDLTAVKGINLKLLTQIADQLVIE